MVQRVSTVAFEGIEARAVDVQVQVAPGLPAFNVVGLPDKAVSEARERVRAALIASGLALPARRITVNMAPADLPKEGSHYDLPIALGLMAAIGAIPHDAVSGLHGAGRARARRLDRAGRRRAAGGDRRERARRGADLSRTPAGRRPPGRAPRWRSSRPDSLIQLANHFKGTQVLMRPQAEDPRDRRRAARPEGHQGPGERQARAGDRGGGRAQPADGRPARRRQVDARGAAALDPAAALAAPSCSKSR